MQAGPSAQSSTSSASLDDPSISGPSVTERLIFVPRDRKCPIFRGRVRIGVSEWMEEAKAYMRVQHLLIYDQAFFFLIIWREKLGMK